MEIRPLRVDPSENFWVWRDEETGKQAIGAADLGSCQAALSGAVHGEILTKPFPTQTAVWSMKRGTALEAPLLEAATEALGLGNPEDQVSVVHEVRDFVVRGRVDRYFPDRDVLMEAKAPGEKTYERVMQGDLPRSWRYQIGAYAVGMEPERVIFVVGGSTPVLVEVEPDEATAWGREALNRFAEAIDRTDIAYCDAMYFPCPCGKPSSRPWQESLISDDPTLACLIDEYQAVAAAESAAASKKSQLRKDILARVETALGRALPARITVRVGSADLDISKRRRRSVSLSDLEAEDPDLAKRLVKESESTYLVIKEGI